ncbi:MAG: HAD family hydrolase [Erysipelotrichaceae bacterium]
MKKIDIVSTDLDGTLLTSDMDVSAYTASVLNQLIDSGVQVVANTGRSHMILPEALSKINFNYIICSNGGSIYDVKNDTIVFSHTLDKKTALDILITTKDLPIAPTITTTKHLYSPIQFKKTFEQAKTPRERDAHRIYLENIFEVLDYPEDIQKIHFVFEEGQKEAYENILYQLKEVAITSSNWDNIEISSNKASKGEMIHTLARLLNIENPMILAYGDNQNDLSQLQYASHFTAMKNASEELLKHAQHITKFTNNEDGVAKDLAQHFNL